ncbi:MAG: trypsin-like peptidase domain-containing protein [Pseudomonadota bacterium]
MRSLYESTMYYGRFALIGLLVALAAFVYARREALLSAPAESPQTLAALKVSYAAAVERAAPSVVNVYVDRSNDPLPTGGDGLPVFDQFLRQPLYGRLDFGARTELGSGVVVDDAGIVITNYHVIRGAGDVWVALWDGRIADATVLGVDQDTDLAVLEITAEGLRAARPAPTPTVQVGDIALAIGNPLGLGKTVTMGIISATGRRDLIGGLYDDFIQTDAAINEGNSGGALVNTRGELIGINTATFARDAGAEGIGFAIPVETAIDVAGQIVDYGQVQRGWLGVILRDPASLPRPPLVDEPIMVLRDVFPGGPAEAAGLRFGDYLTHYDDRPVSTLRELLQRIASTPPGTAVPIRVLRGGEVIETEAELIQRPPGLHLTS